MRLLTLNLQHGRAAIGSARAGQVPGAEGLRELAAQIAAVDPDVVLLQEVDRDQRRSGRVDQAAVLAEALGAGQWRFAASFAGWAGGLRVRPRRTALTRLPGYGVALLSRAPVVSWHVLPLRGAGLGLRRGDRLGWSVGGWHPVIDASRVCLAAVLLTTRGPLSVAVTHLSVDEPTARRQLRQAASALATLPGPHVLGGDLNLEPDGVAATTALRPLATALTFTNVRPRRQLDHLLGSPGLRTTGGRAHHFAVSDHAGLSADVELVGGT